MKIKWTIAYLILFSIPAEMSFAQNNADDILGTWFNEEKTAKISIYKDNGKYQGKIVWLDLQAVDSKFDTNNPEEDKKKRPLVGLILLKDFKYGHGEYSNGEIYDPKNGKTYSCIMKLETKNRLYVRGYIGFSLLGRTTYWTRAK